MRTTKTEVRHTFETLAAVMGKRVATAYNDIGAWTLDYAAFYGGYVIEEISNAGGGVFHPLTERRLSASEFATACRFAILAIEATKKHANAA